LSFSVGMIVNPAAGKDIRRLVAQGRFVPNEEKVNIVKRLLAGLEAAGVEDVVLMPDADMIARAAAEAVHTKLRFDFLEMPVFHDEIDSTRAARLMAERGVGCIITLGGDGTNRAVAKGSGDVPLVPVSTGTNNVFPRLIEGTVAGLAAGVVARSLVDKAKVTRRTRRLEVRRNGELKDIALVDVAVSKESFVGARAIWDMTTVHEIFVTRPHHGAIGLAAIGAKLPEFAKDGASGMYVRLGSGGVRVMAPIAPGVIASVDVQSWRALKLGEPVEVDYRPCTIALDGERTFSIPQGERITVCLTEAGPPVVDIEAALGLAAQAGIFCSTGA